MNECKSYIDKEETISLLKELVSINSINPSLVKGAPGEKEIAEFIGNYMKDLGLDSRILEIEKNRYNSVGIIKGEGGEGAQNLLLLGHMDTVGIDNMEIDPFTPNVKGKKLYGRGSFDMKSGIAAILASAKAIVDAGIHLKGDLILGLVADEEYASIGTDHLVKNLKADGAIMAEASNFMITIAHKGFVWAEINTKGVAAHGSDFQSGVDAITKMGKVLTEFEDLGSTKFKQMVHPLVGIPSMHASFISGGLGLSTYPDKCSLQLERRTIPGESLESVKEEIESIFQKLSEEDTKFSKEYSIIFDRNPMEVSPKEKVVQALKKSVIDIVGKEPKYVGSGGWMDTQILTDAGIPAIAFGGSGQGAHGPVEYVKIDSMVKTAQVFERLIPEFCGIVK